MWRVKHAFAGTVCVWSIASAFMPSATSAGETPPPAAWIRQFGTATDDIASSVKSDSAGDLFVCGTTTGSLGGPYIGGSHDGFIAKYSSTGTQQWVRHFGSTHDDAVGDIAVDKTGDAYVTGYIDLLPSAGNDDIFLVKYSSEGALLWTRQLGTTAIDQAISVAVDSAGNALICGSTYGSLGGPNLGSADALLVKYSPDGDLLWARQFGTASAEGARGVAIDASDNILVCGVTGGSFGGLNVGGSDAFLVKYSSEGALVWARQLGTFANEDALAIAVDNVGNAVITGFTSGGFDGPNAGLLDTFIAKYSDAGVLLWARQFGSTADDSPSSCAVDSVGNAYISGHTQGSLGGQNVGYWDGFIVKYSAAGAQGWIYQMVTPYTQSATSISLDPDDNIIICGRANGEFGDQYLGAADAYVAKFVTPLPVPSDINGDGVVNVNDLLAVINAWGTCPAPPQSCPADIAPPPSGDGRVNVQDLLAVINNWG